MLSFVLGTLYLYTYIHLKLFVTDIKLSHKNIFTTICVIIIASQHRRLNKLLVYLIDKINHVLHFVVKLLFKIYRKQSKIH